MTRAILMPLLLAACVAPAAAPEPQNDEVRRYNEGVEAQFAAPGVVTARLGQTVRLGAAGVRPIAVVEDSRCPHDVECVWAGRLRLRVSLSGVAGEPELTLGQAFALPGGGTLTLVAAAPAPWHDPPPGIARGPANRFGFRRD
jgi:hypothetical protein